MKIDRSKLLALLYPRGIPPEAFGRLDQDLSAAARVASAALEDAAQAAKAHEVFRHPGPCCGGVIAAKIRRLWERAPAEDRDMTRLPTFGGEPPSDTEPRDGCCVSTMSGSPCICPTATEQEE